MVLPPGDLERGQLADQQPDPLSSYDLNGISRDGSRALLSTAQSLALFDRSRSNGPIVRLDKVSRGESSAAVALSSDGNTLAAFVHGGSRLRLWRVEGDKPVELNPSTDTTQVRYFAFSHRSSEVGTLDASQDAEFTRHAPRDGRLTPLRALKTPPGWYLNRWSPLLEFDAEDRRTQFNTLAESGQGGVLPPDSYSFFIRPPHHRTNGVGTAKGDIFVGFAGEPPANLKIASAHSGGVAEALFSPNGQRLVSGDSEPASVRVWEVIDPAPQPARAENQNSPRPGTPGRGVGGEGPARDKAPSDKPRGVGFQPATL